MFADAELDIKKKAKNDEVLASMLDLSNSGFWEQNFELLGAIFHEKGMARGDHHELSKQDFTGILKDADLLIIPKKAAAADDGGPPRKGAPAGEEKKTDEAKEPEVRFDDKSVDEVVAQAFAFDEDQLGYVDFLESLVRIAHAYPFREEQLADMPTFELKMMFFVQALEDKFKGLKQVFA